jgi:hypothetical protein
MKAPVLVRMAVGLAALLVLAGCATNKINWSARVGNATFDQTVLELGPPDKQPRLTDGTLVAEWLTRRGRSATYAPVGGYYGYRGWPYGGLTAYEPGTPDYFLRLTFDAQGILTAWKQYAR